MLSDRCTERKVDLNRSGNARAPSVDKVDKHLGDKVLGKGVYSALGVASSRDFDIVDNHPPPS